MSEIQDAVQIIRVFLEGAEVILKMGKMSWDFTQSVGAIFEHVLEKEKLEGKTSVKKLLKSGGDLQVFKFRTEDLHAVKKLADKYGILYSILPDLNKKDGMSEILFHSQAVPRIQSIMGQIQGAGIESMDDYISNAEPKGLKALTREAKKKYGKNDKESRKGADRSPGSLAENGVSGEKLEEIRNFQKEYIKNPNVNGITIAKKMVMEETEREIKTRIPYKKNEYIWLPKSEITWINNDKTIYAGLEKAKEYQIVDGADRPVRQVSGQELYKQSYDPVNRNLDGREQEKIQRRRSQEQRKNQYGPQQQNGAQRNPRQGNIQREDIQQNGRQEYKTQEKEQQNQNAKRDVQNRTLQNTHQSDNTQKRNMRKKENWGSVPFAANGIPGGQVKAPRGRRAR
ncbi:DUF3801 domain-containing protein [Lachnospiraceae bacterium]|nr:DUF3801 domain-containing protein [uncultured Schaedlerella sp.]NBI99562.1 DUF3801 domain-containing protein [Lachnospiraceae bacterium]